jgi:magnesium-protoporphyrin O-methyltransferase
MKRSISPPHPLPTLYSGPGARFWDRIELERPTTYPEENLVLGRRQEAELLASWLEPVRGLRVLDAGCGRGTFALRLVEGGARVLAVDLVPRFSGRVREAARAGDLALAVGDVGRILRPAGGRTGGFDCAVLREVLQDYTPREGARLLAAIAAAGVPRVLATLRQSSRWDLLLPDLYPPGLEGRVDFTALLREVQLSTPLRLSRRAEVRHRNFCSLVVELRRLETRAAA